MREVRKALATHTKDIGQLQKAVNAMVRTTSRSSDQGLGIIPSTLKVAPQRQQFQYDQMPII